jgi:HAD superfamily hydrolase (TIGR01549 family)
MNNPMKAVFFDYDGVLTLDKTGSLTTCKYLSSITGIELGALLSAYKSFNRELTLGLKTHADIWVALCELLGVDIEEGQLIEAFKSTPLNTRMIELAVELKSRGLLLGIITDNKMDRIQYLRKLQELDHIFDTIVVSSELGFDKKNPEIFTKALHDLTLPPAQCVFIDNDESNLVIPRQLGMRTILHDDVVNDVEFIKLQLTSVIFTLTLLIG